MTESRPVGHSPAGHDVEHAQNVEKVAKLVKNFRFAMLTTLEEDGALVSHPLTIQEAEFDGDLWFLVKKDSSTARNLARDPRAGVSLSSNDSWVSLAGFASLVEDREKIRELWSPGVDAWFPDGQDDPYVGLLKFTAESAEYWDTPGSGITNAINFLKAKVTGETIEGDSGKVEL